MSNDSLLQLANQWIAWDRNDVTRGQIEQLVKEQNWEALKERLLVRISFGTAGLRGRMDAGFSHMNYLTVVQASQGLCEFYKQSGLSSKPVVVGHDHRHHSDMFARLTAGVFLANGIKVYFFKQLVHTPMVPYTIKKLGGGCGVMITASHNPKDDNGYKVYWENSAQINSPIDKGIADAIAANLAPKHWDSALVDTSPLSIDPVAEFDIVNRYFDDLGALSSTREENSSSSVKFVYTAMHGVGHPFAVEAFKRFRLPPFHSVAEQQDPDPDFSTVKFPNPEEGKDSLDLSIKHGDALGASIILANDPDADRFSVTEKQPNGPWRIFTGNEIGVMLAVYLLEQYRSLNPEADSSKLAMLRSAVSSCMIDAICQQEGVKIEETLTGFKWLGNRAIELEKEGFKVLLAYEEAIGFMLNDHVKDKDGVSTLAVFSEMASGLAKKGITLAKQMDHIFEKYGYFVSNNSYFICHSNEAKQAVFDDMRYFGGSTGEIKFPTKIGDFEITGVRDLQVGFDTSSKDQKPLLPFSKSNMMVTFKFSNGAVATIRTSGTEPKLKFYIEHHGPFAEKEQVNQQLEKISAAIIEHLIQPKKHGLQERSSK